MRNAGITFASTSERVAPVEPDLQLCGYLIDRQRQRDLRKIAHLGHQNHPLEG